MPNYAVLIHWVEPRVGNSLFTLSSLKIALLINEEWEQFAPCPSLTKSDLLIFESKLHFRAQKTSDSLKKSIVFTMFLTVFHWFSHFYARERIAPVALSCRVMGAIRSQSLSLKSDHECFAPFALYKIVMGVIRSWKRANRYFALSITKNERFARKTKEQIPNPGSHGVFQKTCMFYYI